MTIKEFFAQTWVSVVAWILTIAGVVLLIVTGISTDNISSIVTLIGTGVAGIVAVYTAVKKLIG